MKHKKYPTSMVRVRRALLLGLLSCWTVLLLPSSSSSSSSFGVEGATAGARSSSRAEKEKQRRKRHRQGNKNQGRTNPPPRFFFHKDNSNEKNHRERKRGTSWEGFSFQLNTTSALSLLFPTHQPRHVAEGAANLCKSLLAGLGLSFVSLVAMPIAGFREAGWPGLLAGGLTGSLYAALFGVMGIANGAWQMLRGVVETPRAVQAARRGYILWDAGTERWTVYHLRSEYEQLRPSERSSFSNAAAAVMDDAYYQRLGVPVTATTAEIKRAYYRQARAVHPDKNPNDDDAAEQFRQLHVAYLVLSDEDKRTTYDRVGPERPPHTADDGSGGMPNIPLFDPHVFFGILFHSENVDPYVGMLTVASFTDQVLQLARVNAPAEECLHILLRQGGLRARKRQVEIALFLQQRTNAYTSISSSSTTTTTTTTSSGKEEEEERRQQQRHEYYETCREEARQIAASGPFGTRYLTAIGSALVLEANQYLGFHQSFVTGVVGLVRKRTRGYRSSWSIAKETLGLFKTFIKRQLDQQSGQQPEIETVILPRLMDVTWAYAEKDIRKTLQGACMRLFADAGNGDEDVATTATADQRVDRATAVRLLGEAFLEVASAQHQHSTRPDGHDDVDDELLTSRVHIAYQIASQEGKRNYDDNVEDIIKQHALNLRVLKKRQQRRSSRR